MARTWPLSDKKPTGFLSDIGHANAVMHVAIANPGGGENFPGIPGAFETRNLTYLARGPCQYGAASDSVSC